MTAAPPAFPSPADPVRRQIPLQDYSPFRDTGIPIVIDNGSRQLRAGWASEEQPRLQFENIVAKSKSGKTKAGADALLVGDDVYLGGFKSNSKTAFDGGVVVNAVTFENTLDYIFSKLSIDTDRVNHPIVMTEALCNPEYSRKLVSELLFESYRVSSVTYGVDALFSYYANNCSFDAGLILSAGNTASHIIPVLNGRPVIEHCKRLSCGGQQLSEFLQKLLQVKYPSFPQKISVENAQSMLFDHGYVALDYASELRAFSVPENIDKHTRVVQYPYVARPDEDELREEAERLLEKRREQGRRLQEQAVKMRTEKLEAKVAYLEELKELLDARNIEDRADWLDRLTDAGFDDEADLEHELKETEDAVRRARNKLSGNEEPDEKTAPSFPLVDLPDDQLTDEQKKEKRKQRLFKANWEARERMRREKEEEEAREAELARQEEERRLRDPEGWLRETRQRRQALFEKIRTRQKRKAQLNDRRSAESKNRMRNIAHLAAEEEPGAKRRRGAGKEDNFGARDEDWHIYKEISKEDNSDEDEEAFKLGKLDELLMAYDPGFVPDDPYEEATGSRNTILYRLCHGSGQVDLSDPAVQNQLRLNVERIRAPEALFQPSMMGLDEAGVVEVLNDATKRFTPDVQAQLVQNIFVTGGAAVLSNLSERIERDIRSLRPYGSAISVRRAADPRVDAWRGAARWFRNEPENFKKSMITREMYDEYGHDYLMEHSMSNLNWPSS